MKKARFVESTVTLPFPEEIWRQIFRCVPEEGSWTNILSSCKYFNRVAEEVFVDIVTSPSYEKYGSWQDSRYDLQQLFSGHQEYIYGNEWLLPLMTAKSIPLTFPMLEPLCKELISRSSVTPFGKGRQTIIDSEVRSGWQIDASDLIFTNTQWTSQFATSTESSLLENIRKSLAPDNAIIRAELYKFLIYGPGDKFQPHKDTLRGVNHFGTLIVFLPSYYKGGDFVINHNNMEESFNFSLENNSHNWNQIQWIAFYTDCLHEVKPVTEGYRVALTYNLYIEGTWNPIRSTNTLKYEMRYLRACAIESEDEYVGFLLTHEYSKLTLEPSQLKGNDKKLYQIFANSKWLQSKLVAVKIQANGTPAFPSTHQFQPYPRERGKTLGDLLSYVSEITVTSDVGTTLAYVRGDSEQTGSAYFPCAFSDSVLLNAQLRTGGLLGNDGSDTEEFLYTSGALLISLSDLYKNKVYQ